MTFTRGFSRKKTGKEHKPLAELLIRIGGVNSAVSLAQETRNFDELSKILDEELMPRKEELEKLMGDNGITITTEKTTGKKSYAVGDTGKTAELFIGTNTESQQTPQQKIMGILVKIEEIRLLRENIKLGEIAQKRFDTIASKLEPLRKNIEEFQKTILYKIGSFFGFYKNKEDDKKQMDDILSSISTVKTKIESKQHDIASEKSYGNSVRLAAEMREFIQDTTRDIRLKDDELSGEEISSPIKP